MAELFFNISALLVGGRYFTLTSTIAMVSQFYAYKRFFIRYGLVITCLVRSVCSWGQKTYYVSSAGSDTNNGFSETSPIQSLSKVNALLLRPGDAILFRRGDVFRGTLLINQSGTAENPIRYGAYGAGPKPVLMGSVPVRDWVRIDATKWQASCADCGSRVTGLYKNGLSQPLGRYPNADAPNRGSLTVQAHVGTGQLTSQQPLTTDWTGGEVVARTHYWIIDRATITSQQANTLTLANASNYTLTDNWGFFIQNHPATLDRPGEWYYDPVKRVIQLYADQENPAEQLFTATAFDEAIRITNAAFVNIQQLSIAQARTTNLNALNASNLTLIDNDITDAGEDGLLIQGTGSNLLIDHNTIVRSNNNGVNISGYQGVIFRGNTVRNVGLLAGRGKSGDGQYTGFQSASVQQLLIDHNVIDSVGYSGVSVQNSTTIRQNLITNFCMTKCDGGGVYLWNGKQLPMNDVHIQANIIRYGIGTPGGLLSDTPGGAHGIFLDDCVEGTEVSDNTIADCQGFGIYLHAVSNVGLVRNTCFNNSAGQLSLYHYDAPCHPRNNYLSQNILVAKTATQTVACYESGSDDLTSFGRMEQNYYARPFYDEFTIRAVYNRTIGDDISLSQWQGQFKQDLTSKISPLTFKDYRVKSLISTNYIDTAPAAKAGGWETWSPYNNGQVSWDKGTQLTTGNLTIGFSKASGKADSYLLVYKGIQAVTKSTSYLVRFDVAALTAKKVAVFIRQRQAPYQDLTRRYEFMAEPTRKHVEFALSITADEADALLTFQVGEDGQPVWLNNVQLQEAIIEPVNPDKVIQLICNPTLTDSLYSLDGPYRDIKNHYYKDQIQLKPFSSVLMLRDTLPPVDIHLSVRADQVMVATSDVVSVSVTIQNQSSRTKALPSQVQWQCQLPANLTLIGKFGGLVEDSVLTGTVQQLQTDTTFVFWLRARASGQYVLSAQITSATYGDPDSTPNSGTGDGEDDQASITLFVTGFSHIQPVSAVRIGVSQSPDAEPESLVVYPNPATEAFTVTAADEVTEMRVIDLLGRERLTIKTISQGEPVQFGHFLPGAPYLLYIQYKTGKQRVMKLIKQGGFSE